MDVKALEFRSDQIAKAISPALKTTISCTIQVRKLRLTWTREVMSAKVEVEKIDKSPGLIDPNLRLEKSKATFEVYIVNNDLNDGVIEQVAITIAALEDLWT